MTLDHDQAPAPLPAAAFTVWPVAAPPLAWWQLALHQLALQQALAAAQAPRRPDLFTIWN